MLKVCEVVSESLPELVVQLLLVLQESGSHPPRPDRVDGLHTLRPQIEFVEYSNIRRNR